MFRTSAKLCALTILALCALTTSGAAWGARAESELDSMRGLNGIYLVVENLQQDVVKDGLTTDMLKKAAEAKLKAAGIPVLTDSEFREKPQASLYIAVSCVKSKAGIYVYSMDAELIQAATLVRDSGVVVPATTWTNGMIGAVEASNITKLSTAISALVDDFVTDYISVNSNGLMTIPQKQM